MNYSTAGIDQLRDITQSFDTTFSEYGYQEVPAVAITDKRVDQSVRFVGAPISAMKPYLGNKTLPNPGLRMVQNCVRTQNLANMYTLDDTPTYGSFFTAMGTLTTADRLIETFEETSAFFANTIGVNPSEAFISMYSGDTDIVAAAQENGIFPVRSDVRPRPYYKHTYGMDGIQGRNTSYWVRNTVTGEYEDIGNVIVIENTLGKIGVELALGDTTALKQSAGLSHVLDSYSLNIAPDADAPVRRRLEDAVVTSLVLRSEGLEPSAHNDQTRILRSYHKAISLHRRLAHISLDTLVTRMELIERQHLPICQSTNAIAIGNWVAAYESRLAHTGAQNQEDQKILALLEGDRAE